MHLNEKIYIFIEKLECKLSEKEKGSLTLFLISLHFLTVDTVPQLLPASSAGFFHYDGLHLVVVS